MRSRFAPMLLWCSADVFAMPGEIVSDYGYPFADPLEATVVGTPAEYQAALPEEIPIEDARGPRASGAARYPRSSGTPPPCAIRCRRSPGRRAARVHHPRHRRQFQCGQEPDPAERSCTRRDSTWSRCPRRCIRTSSSARRASRRPGLLARGRPGHLPGDGADPPLISRTRSRSPSYDLVGYSLGATNAAFVAELDDERRLLRLRRVLLINPPVSLYRSARVLDRSVRGACSLDRRLQRLVQPADAGRSRSSTRPTEPMLFSDDSDLRHLPAASGRRTALSRP